jgi:hypothetical protein
LNPLLTQGLSTKEKRDLHLWHSDCVLKACEEIVMQHYSPAAIGTGPSKLTRNKSPAADAPPDAKLHDGNRITITNDRSTDQGEDDVIDHL